ncbi:hypothetical protein BDQ17DRAFT_367330 [Cyathus striatus]|nr:hypothetical protein BDQ17DRAFT_367330 [Cyathus striatus]
MSLSVVDRTLVVTISSPLTLPCSKPHFVPLPPHFCAYLETHQFSFSGQSLCCHPFYT